ncbi:transketolase [Amycolatopsis magusensis]|uniref:Transketolase n=1 Tax=Amycolatopsis magusensis TaxID=882444 RepID=A0ABS4PU32_9PSEU|nr:transketolase [Amycolatopsis magusensis]MBP2182941.1 transketolase [Amycolatopsis magusensis]
MTKVAKPVTADAGSVAAARRVREHVVRMCGSADGGHLGGSMSLVEILLTLYRRVLRVDPAVPDAPDRDILLLSKGHGAIGLYAVLAEQGFLPVERLAEYGRPGSSLMAHPTMAVPGVEMPSGALGHGLSIGVGYALAARMDGSDRRCFVVLGDGELQEGSVWEAAMAAAGLGLDGVTAVVDRNGLQITGKTEGVVGLEPLADRWRAFGWVVDEVDGHDTEALAAAFLVRPQPGKPRVVIARTVKGKGLPYVENKVHSHYARLGERQQRRALAELRAHESSPGSGTASR